jgi:hypothetical protein
MRFSPFENMIVIMVLHVCINPKIPGGYGYLPFVDQIANLTERISE